MPAHNKKVILRKWNREWLSGYLPPLEFPGAGHVAILAVDGTVTSVPLTEVKWICFVRAFPGSGADDPERLLQRSFARRPRSPGIWFRIRLDDNDRIEGLAQNDLSFLDASGLAFTPPDSRSNTQRLFVPRRAIRELEILAVVRAGTPKTRQPALQQSLFDAPLKGGSL